MKNCDRHDSRDISLIFSVAEFYYEEINGNFNKK